MKSAPKGGARPRRAFGAKETGKTASNCTRRLIAFLAVTFFLCYHFSRRDGEVQLGSGGANGSRGAPCRGRYIYVYNQLPPRFNTDIIRDCRKAGGRHWPDMCGSMSNAGLGQPLAEEPVAGGVVFSGENGWYDTHQSALDVIFHNRMKQYDCLTNRSALAAAVFVPFYASLDFARHLGGDHATRDAASADLAEWLKWRPEWDRVMGGRDHFLVAGRTALDLRRDGNVDSPNWGTNLLSMPAGRNMSVLVVDSSSPPHGSGVYAVPYPTCFHPRTDADVFRWQDRVRNLRRKWLMALAVAGAGARRPENPRNIREQIVAQCKASSTCSHLGFAIGTTKCQSPVNIMRHFQTATFCLQPPDDSFTRRSAFDAMVAGCIPVFFHPRSAYLQYEWHLPKDHTKYSVFIPEEDVRAGKVNIEATLRAIPLATVEAMREEVVRLIPAVVYADPRSKLETVRDAFDIAVDGVIDRVTRLRKSRLRSGLGDLS